ncbi:MAG: transporter substrate-binding domain-containing protein, partial [Gammaproteobacteria bacterium]|nr:transporter substrate-binding domain-containing protein [Gammaproteobacteria bacterium]
MLQVYKNLPYRVILIILICGSLIPLWLGIASSTNSQKLAIPLTDEEQAWLQEHPLISVGVSSQFEPAVNLNFNGTYTEIYSDIYYLLGRRLGVRFNVVDDEWPEILRRTKTGELDIVNRMTRPFAERMGFLTAQTAFDFQVTVYAKKDRSFELMREDDIEGLRVAYARGAMLPEDLQGKIKTVVVDNVLDGFEAVLEDRADVMVGWNHEGHLLTQYNIHELEPALIFDSLQVDSVMAVRSDAPLLAAIIEKALNSISDGELNQILSKWTLAPATKNNYAFLRNHQISADRMGAKALVLTELEKQWLKDHPAINVVDDFAWPPYVYQDKDGKLAGLASSYIELFTQELGIEFVPQFGLSWNQAIEKFKSSQSDFLPALVRTKEREEFIAFTKPFISFPVVVTTRSDSPFIDNLNDLVGQRVGVVEGYLNQKRLSEQYPDLLVIPLANVAKGIEALAEKEIDAFVGNLGVVYYEKQRLGLDAVIKVAAPTPFIDDLSFGVRKDWPELVSILNKILASMTDREKKAIKHDWIGVTVAFGTPFSTIFKWAVPILLISLAIFIFIVVSNRRLEREVEARYRTEIALKAAKEIVEKASLAKSIFLTNMSHELRTPLNAILGFSRMMGLDSEASSSQLDRLAIINRAGEHLLEMINGVLDLAKIESGQIQLELKQFDLPQLLEDIGQMFGMRAEDAGLSFDQVIEPSMPHYIKSDDGKLRQILINLLGNAIKFTTEGGVSLRASTYPIKGSPEMVILQLEVEDSGLGILPEQQERIFDPFVQGTSHSNTVRGTGLGLTISKSFIDLMGGAIDVESEPGKGTLFRIELPMALADAPDLDELVCSAPIVTGLESGQPPWRILIVEDNPDSRLLLLDLLTQV